jgi:hypothetical protein
MNLTEALARSRNAKQANPQAHGVAGRMPRRTGVLGDHGTPGLGWKDCAGGAFRPDPSRLPTTLDTNRVLNQSATPPTDPKQTWRNM